MFLGETLITQIRSAVQPVIRQVREKQLNNRTLNESVFMSLLSIYMKEKKEKSVCGKKFSLRRNGKRQKAGRMCAVLFAAVLLAFSILFCGCGDHEAVENLFRSEGVLHTESTSEGKYAYETLNDDAKLVYDQIVYAIEKRKDDVRLATTSLKEMRLAYQAVRYDHCEYFWLKKFTYVTFKNGKKITAIDFKPEFSMSAKKQEATQEKIDREAKKMLKNAPRNGSDFAKVLYVYRKMINTVDYDKNASNSQNIISTFLNHKTVCQGYAYGTQYLLHKLGISCTTIEGTTEGQNHAWNLVKMDGDWYYVDTTWGNSQYVSYINGSSNSSGKFIDYYFMGMTSEDIADSHAVAKGIPVPDCKARRDNYFVRKDLYFDSWEPVAIGNRIAKAYTGGKSQIQLEFSDMDIYEQAVQYFMEEYHISSYCRGLKKVRYIEIPEKNILYILFK